MKGSSQDEAPAQHLQLLGINNTALWWDGVMDGASTSHFQQIEVSPAGNRMPPSGQALGA